MAIRRYPGLPEPNPPREVVAQLRPAIRMEPPSAQRPECGTDFLGEKLWLLPRGEVPALVELVVVDEVGIGLLSPTPRGFVELVGEDAYGSWDGYALDGEEGELVLLVDASRGHPGVRQPEKRDVVEDVVSR